MGPLRGKSFLTIGSARVTGASSTAPRVSIMIPVAANPVHLAACLRSLERCMPMDVTFEVILVLNSPTDYLAVLAESTIETRVIAASTNLGLAGAGNRARAEARGEFLVLLHDDAQIEQGWMEALLDAAANHPRAGAVGCKVLFPDGRLQGAGQILWRDGTTSPPWLGSAPSAGSFAEARAVDYTGTSSLLIRSATWDSVGGLDEQFFPVYYVDVDLAMKIRSRGQFVLYEPRARIRHHQGASGDLRWRWFVTYRNRAFFLAKWRAKLEDHEVRVKGSQEAIESAMHRAALFAARVEANKSLAPDPRDRASFVPFDSAQQERRALQMALDLSHEYAEALESGWTPPTA